MASVVILIAATLWLVAAIAIVRAPRLAAALYLLAALACAAGAPNEPDLWAWSAISLGIAILSFRGGQTTRSLIPAPA